MNTAASILNALGSICFLLAVVLGPSLLRPRRLLAPEPPAELVAAISGWPPPALAPAWGLPVYANWPPPVMT